MASNEVKIKVIIDGHTHSLNAARKDVNELGKSLANTDTVANALKGTFGKIALSLGGVTALGVAVKNVATSGIEANRSFENLKIQLTGLISANSSNVSLLGKTLDAHSKWNLGMVESEKILKKLNETNAKTKFTLEEIAGAFNMFYATSAGQGSRDKAVQAMDSIALAAQAVGKNIRDLTPMMDSLATGTVIAASEMGSFMKIVGLSNEELKKANENGKVYDYLIEKLTKFKELSGEAANGYEVALGSLKNELTELNKELSKPIFGALTTGMVTFSNLLRENKDDLVKYGGYAIETMKHLGLLAGSFIAAKGAVIALSGAFSMIKGAIAAAAAMMPAFTSSLTLSITTGVVLEKGLATLNRAFATLLPAATIYLLYESIDAIKALNGNLEDGAKNLNSVQKWIYRFLDSFTTQLQIAHIKIYQFINDLKIMALKAKEFFDSINPFSRGEGAKDAQKDIALLEKYNQAYDELIEKYKQGAVAKELNLQGFKLDENGNILTDAKQKVDKLKDSIDKLGGSAGNAGKKDLNAMKAALKDIAEVNFSDMELKTQRVIDRYNEILSLGIDKGKAKHFLDSKLEAIANENIKSVEKSEAEAIAKQLDLRAEYYKSMGEYENAWQIEKQKIIEKYEKLTFENGEKLTKEQLDKLLKMEKTAFLQGAKIAKNSFKDIKGSWADTVSSMQKTVEDGFFNFFIGKTKSLKTALKDIGTNLFRDMISPYARALSQGISGGFGALLGGGSNLASIASNLGLAKNDSGGWIGSVGGTTVELSSTGQILRGADALDKGTTNLLGSISNLKTAYSAFTGLFEGGYSGFISNLTSNPALAAKGWLNGLGYSKLGTAVYDFGAGAQGVLTNSSMPAYFSTGGTVSPSYVAGGAFAGAGIGYAAGTLGDWLTGTQTKAGLGGAIGGGIGGGLASAGLISNPVGWVIAAVGLVIGSFISKAKQTDAGLFLRAAIGAALDEKIDTGDIQKYTEKTKKNWWRKKVSWEYDALDAKTAALLEQSTKAVQMSLRGISATNGLVLSAGHFSANSFLNENLALGALSSFTGLARNIALEDSHRATIKKWNLSNIFVGPGSKKIFDKAGKLISNTLGDKAEKLLRKGALIGGYGMAPQLGLINKTDDIAKTPAQIEAENARLVEMRKSFEAYAKEQKKQVLEVIVESLNTVNQSVIDIELSDLKNPILKAAVSVEKAIDAFSLATDNSFGEIGDILQVSAESFKNKYLEALRNDFTKENVDKWNAAKIAFDAARKAQEDYTKAVISFTQQTAQTQGGFYQSHGINTDFLAQQATYTKFRTLLSSLNGEISKEEKDSIGKFGEFGNIQTWSKYLLSMTARDMQGFMSAGNTELRNDLIATITEYQRQIQANGGKEFWLKSFTDIENIDKQIAALKLAKQTEETLKVQQEKSQREMQMQKEQLSILNLQKAAVEKIGNIAQRIRNQVIDRTTSHINYANALKAAKEAYARGDYRSKAFDNLSEAADHQRQFFEDTLSSYEEYRFSMLSMASEIEAISEKTTLADINAAIESLEKELEKTKKTLDEEMKKANSLAENQIFALEQQRMQLIQNSQNEIKALDSLLGTNAPLILYLRGIMEQLLNKERGALENGKKEENNGARIKAPIYTGGVENINTTATTANGAILTSALDQSINQLYLSILGRSADQSGLEYWRGVATKQNLSMAQISEEIIKAATAQFGTSDREIWKQMQKGFGLKPFADGGIVTRPTRALIGEAGYNEAIIPLKDGRGVKVDMDGGFELLSNTMNRLEQVSQKIEKNTKELVLFLRGVISEDGEKIQAKVLA